MDKFVIFDMDGVLVDSEPIHMELERLLFGQLGIQVPVSLHESFVGMAPQKVWLKLKQEFGLPQDVEALLELEKEVKYNELQARQIHCMPAVDALLEELKSNGYKLSVASSSPRNIIHLVLEKLNFKSYFDYLVSSEDVKDGKPAPDIFLEVAHRYQVPASRFIVIEDSHNGVKAAKAAGMPCIGYQSAHSGNQDLTLADLITDDFRTLRVADFEQMQRNKGQ